MTTDWWARGLGIAGIVVGLASPVASYFIWLRSGSRLKVKLYLVEPTTDRLDDVVRIEVSVTGFQPAVIQRIQLGQRVPTVVVSSQQRYGSKWFLDATPSDGREALGRLVSPTDRVVADVPIADVANHVGWNVKGVLLLAKATRGDGRERTSKVSSFSTQRKT